jgi:hypothetical protein
MAKGKVRTRSEWFAILANFETAAEAGLTIEQAASLFDAENPKYPDSCGESAGEAIFHGTVTSHTLVPILQQLRKLFKAEKRADIGWVCPSKKSPTGWKKFPSFKDSRGRVASAEKEFDIDEFDDDDSMAVVEVPVVADKKETPIAE